MKLYNNSKEMDYFLKTYLTLYMKINIFRYWFYIPEITKSYSTANKLTTFRDTDYVGFFLTTII